MLDIFYLKCSARKSPYIACWTDSPLNIIDGEKNLRRWSVELSSSVTYNRTLLQGLLECLSSRDASSPRRRYGHARLDGVTGAWSVVVQPNTIEFAGTTHRLSPAHYFLFYFLMRGRCTIARPPTTHYLLDQIKGPSWPWPAPLMNKRRPKMRKIRPQTSFGKAQDTIKRPRALGRRPPRPSIAPTKPLAPPTLEAARTRQADR